MQRWISAPAWMDIESALAVQAVREPSAGVGCDLHSFHTEHAPNKEARVDIRIDNLQQPDIIRLLQEHLDDMHRHSPPDSVHALDLDALRRPEINVWTVRHRDGELMGCGALKALDDGHGEIKSMRTASRHLRKGVAATLLRHILQEARHRGYRRLSLETGSMEVFEPARELYERFGFKACGPFAEYVEDPYSMFMTIEI